MTIRSFYFTVATMAIFASSTCVADSFPGRRSGMWESVTTGQGAAQSVKECVDQAQDREAMAHPKPHPGATCEMAAPKKVTGDYEVSGTCKMTGTSMTFTTLSTGDFNSKITSVVKTSFSPPLFGQQGTTIKVESRYVGACEAGMKAGEFQAGSGARMTRDEAMKMGEQAQAILNDPQLKEIVGKAMQQQAAQAR